MGKKRRRHGLNSSMGQEMNMPVPETPVIVPSGATEPGPMWDAAQSGLSSSTEGFDGGFSQTSEAPMTEVIGSVISPEMNHGSLIDDESMFGADPFNTVDESFAAPIPRHLQMIRMNGEAATFGSELIQSMIPIYTAAFQRVHGRSASPAELEAVMAVGRHEGGFGTYKYPGGTGLGCNNHGAVQCCKPDADGKCPPGSFLASDTTPTASGSVPYAICFKCYATPEDGAADVIKKVGKRPLELLNKTGGSLAGFSVGMYHNNYFEGFNAPQSTLDKYGPIVGFIERYLASNKVAKKGATSAQMAGRVLNYAIGLDRNAEAIAKGSDRPRRTTLTVKAFGFELPQVAAGGAAAIGLLGLYKWFTRKKSK